MAIVGNYCFHTAVQGVGGWGDKNSIGWWDLVYFEGETGNRQCPGEVKCGYKFFLSVRPATARSSRGGGTAGAMPQMRGDFYRSSGFCGCGAGSHSHPGSNFNTDFAANAAGYRRAAAG